MDIDRIVDMNVKIELSNIKSQTPQIDAKTDRMKR